LLPRTSCKECGRPTAPVFASLVEESIKEPQDCAKFDPEQGAKLKRCIEAFDFEL